MNITKRKKKVLDTAHRLFIEKGYQATSIQDIIDEAEISKGTFYNYFASKKDCLLAIIEFIEAEGKQKRMELAIGKDKQDEEVFIKQVAVRIDMTRKYHIHALIDSVMEVDKLEITKYVNQQFRSELQWLAMRLREVYTPGIPDYAFDQSVMLSGMIHHFLYVWNMGASKELEAERVIRFIIKRLKPAILEQVESGETFFDYNWLSVELDDIPPNDRLDILLQDIDQLIVHADGETLAYLTFLKEEITSNSPREFLIESVLLSLKQTFAKTERKHEINQIVQLVHRYLHDMEKVEV
ncbi:TetR/AcrR family transcriptional regulator [Ornithinibacillus sp. FSL M8-0202]|uniref:TetR/AcrR family transcriptional regulator n=1 Tax=unclassified Ornithinibacillus TaxID=2620869 RepID=UPI0030D40D54